MTISQSSTYLLLFPAILAVVSAQWHHDVIKSEFTCENLVFSYPSCLHSASCISDFFLECKCVPKDLKKVFDFSGSIMDGHSLCLYATYSLQVGEPRCCEFYKRGIYLKRPDYLLTVKDIDVPKVETRSSESRSSEQISGERDLDNIVPSAAFDRLLNYDRELLSEIESHTNDNKKDSRLQNNQSKRARSNRRSLNKRSKLLDALKCIPLDKSMEDLGYEQIDMDKKH